MLAGQPGARKTVLSTMMTRNFDSNAAFVNADDFRRFHPNYRELYAAFASDSVSKTSQFASEVSNLLIDKLSTLHYNLIIEGTGRTVDIPKNTADLLSQKGYEIEMAVIATRPEISLISTLLRFYEMNSSGTIPRATAINAHDNVVDVLPDNLDILLEQSKISRISIWDRELNMLYDSAQSSDVPSTILVDYWESEWSEFEIESTQHQIQRLYNLESQENLGQSSVIEEIESRFIRAIEKSQEKLFWGPTL